MCKFIALLTCLDSVSAHTAPCQRCLHHPDASLGRCLSWRTATGIFILTWLDPWKINCYLLYTLGSRSVIQKVLSWHKFFISEDEWKVQHLFQGKLKYVLLLSEQNMSKCNVWPFPRDLPSFLIVLFPPPSHAPALDLAYLARQIWDSWNSMVRWILQTLHSSNH